MATLTQVKRGAFPARYAKKDARTAILRAVYGRMGGCGTRGGSYRDGRYCSYDHAYATFHNLYEVTQWSEWRKAEIAEDIRRLKSRPKVDDNA